MPYIAPHARTHLTAEKPMTEGELNYAITMLLIHWVKHRGLSYTTINAAIGAVEAAKMEFYRRVAVPYEDKKIAENGDVYP